MSGSKHSTHRDLKKALNDEDNSTIDYDEAVRKTNTIYRELVSKHYIKKKTLRLRQMRKTTAIIDNMPNNKFYNYDVLPRERIYKVEEENFEGVIFPIYQADIKSIINELPSSMTFNLKQIKLTHNEFEKNEILPGIWSSTILGTAFIGKNKINLYGYEIKESSNPFIDQMLFYLKVNAMGTLIHELAHHYDFTLSYARKGRYRNTKELDIEEYAHHVERDFYLNEVCKYIEEKYYCENMKFKKWMVSIGCLPLELKYFDPGLMRNPDYYILSNLFWGLYEGIDSIELNLTLANELYTLGEIEASEKYVNYILENQENNENAQKLKGKILLHGENK